LESVKANEFLNAKTNIKKLQLGGDKCKKLHFGKKKHLFPELYVDSWILEKKNENEKGIKNLTDVYDGDFETVLDEFLNVGRIRIYSVFKFSPNTNMNIFGSQTFTEYEYEYIRVTNFHQIRI
jgi:hypothetical protein